MQKRKAGQELPPTGFKRGGKHRSTVKGEQRFLAGKKKSSIEDALRQNADDILRRIRKSAPASQSGVQK